MALFKWNNSRTIDWLSIAKGIRNSRPHRNFNRSEPFGGIHNQEITYAIDIQMCMVKLTTLIHKKKEDATG